MWAGEKGIVIKGELTFIKGGWIFREVEKQEGGEKERSKIVAAIREAKARRRREIQIHIQWERYQGRK